MAREDREKIPTLTISREKKGDIHFSVWEY